MDTYLVTGASGFIGSNIVKALLEKNKNIVAVDNLSTGRIQNIEPYLNYIKFYREDITVYPKLLQIFQENDIDYILHQAAIPSVSRSVNDPVKTNNANINGTLNILLAARDNNIKKMVFASSSSVYGDTPMLPKQEDMKPSPKSPYAISKLTGEYYCKVFSEIYSVNTVMLRYFNVFGPNQDPTSQYSAAIPRFVTAVLKNESPIVYGDGEQSRDFTFVENVVSANMLAAKSEVTGEVINISGGKRITINEVISIIQHKLGKKVEVKYVEARAGDVRHSLGDISKAKKCIGYEPVADFEKGIEKSIDWYKDN